MKGFRDIVQEFCRFAKVPIQRTGIRYINIFDSTEIKVQKNFFSNDIGATLVTKMIDQDGPLLVRSMHTNEYRINTMKIAFRYGLYNPEYPSVLSKNSFVLDYDCYIDDALEGSENVVQTIEQGHEYIQALFEDSITDSLRKVLNNEWLY